MPQMFALLMSAVARTPLTAFRALAKAAASRFWLAALRATVVVPPGANH